MSSNDFAIAMPAELINKSGVPNAATASANFASIVLSFCTSTSKPQTAGERFCKSITAYSIPAWAKIHTW